jgi:peptide/nickel transport system substrate-binding protein
MRNRTALLLALSASSVLASAPVKGGTLTVALWQEPESLNPYTAIQTVSRLIRKQTLEGLWDVAPNGEYQSVLAASVPTVGNGGVSKDGKTVTVRLRPNLKWQDGHPVTSADVKFTWNVIMDEANPVSSRSGYDEIAGIDTPNASTAVIRFKRPYAPYLTLFSIAGAILPQHALRQTDVSKADFNRKPEGTGPFMVSEWKSASNITMVRNPNYRTPGKPYLDRVIFKFVPSREIATAQLTSGEVDSMWNLLENQIPQLERVPGVKLLTTPSPNLEYLGFNLASGEDPATPHPILGDARVRQAIGLTIDKKVLVDRLLYGRAQVASSAIPLGWAADKTIAPAQPDVARARQLLDQAGWRAGSDGIRTKNGQRLTLSITTTTGDQLRLLAEQVLQAQLREVGLDLVIKNVPSSVMFGGYDKNGPLKKGNFDVAMDTWGPDADPADYMSIRFASDQIPTAKNGGAGWNFTRIKDATLDKALLTAQSTLDQQARKTAYAVALRRINVSGAYIPLYTRLFIDGFRERVRGYQGNTWDEFGWDSENWYLEGR